MKISVIITNWNGLSLLKKNLEPIITLSPEASEFILADDASTDSSLKFAQTIANKYPQLRILAQKNNLGFGENSNQAVKQAKGELVVLLNNDILPKPGYISATLKHFADPKIFGVGFAEVGHENWARIFWQFGYLQHEPGHPVDQTHISAWLSGGGSIVRKKIFEQLGGFDSVYQPCYSEDLDLGLRAWKSGYTLLWEPSAQIYHHHEATMSQFPKRQLDYIKERNRLLVVWRNFTSPRFRFLNRLAMIGRVLGGPNYLKIIIAAKKQISRHPSPIFSSQRSESEVLRLFAP